MTDTASAEDMPCNGAVVALESAMIILQGGGKERLRRWLSRKKEILEQFMTSATIC